MAVRGRCHGHTDRLGDRCHNHAPRQPRSDLVAPKPGRTRISGDDRRAARVNTHRTRGLSRRRRYPTAEAIRAAGGLPVFGPARVEALIDLLGSFADRAAVCLPASPGRTDTEAHARLANDPELAIAARAAPGLVGTLEQCQQTVAALRAAGMSELRLRLPATSDLADVIAQVSTLRGDVLAGLRPGAPRSPDPSAPAGWGGRA